MDIGKSFTYVMEDPNWIKKVLVGGGILFVGIVFIWLLAIPLLLAGIILTGYTLTVIRNVAESNQLPLPEWSDFGGLFMKGLYGVLGTIVLYLPAILIACCAGGVGALPSMSKDVPSAVQYVAMCLNCLQGLFFFVLGLIQPAAMTRFAMIENQVSVFWDFRGNLDFIMKNLSNYIIAVIVAAVASMISMFGIILCGIGLPFTLFWSGLVGAFLYGELWRASQGRGVVPAT